MTAELTTMGKVEINYEKKQALKKRVACLKAYKELAIKGNRLESAKFFAERITALEAHIKSGDWRMF